MTPDIAVAEAVERAPYTRQCVVRNLDDHLRKGLGQHLFKNALLPQRDDDDAQLVCLRLKQISKLDASAPQDEQMGGS
jgi:hypothetical protein